MLFLTQVPVAGLLGVLADSQTLDSVPQVVRPSRIPPLCALVPRVQGSSGAVSTVQFVWRGHAKTPTTRAGPWPDFALRLE